MARVGDRIARERDAALNAAVNGRGVRWARLSDDLDPGDPPLAHDPWIVIYDPTPMSDYDRACLVLAALFMSERRAAHLVKVLVGKPQPATWVPVAIQEVGSEFDPPPRQRDTALSIHAPHGPDAAGVMPAAA